MSAVIIASRLYGVIFARSGITLANPAQEEGAGFACPRGREGQERPGSRGARIDDPCGHHPSLRSFDRKGQPSSEKAEASAEFSENPWRIR